MTAVTITSKAISLLRISIEKYSKLAELYEELEDSTEADYRRAKFREDVKYNQGKADALKEVYDILYQYELAKSKNEED